MDLKDVFSSKSELAAASVQQEDLDDSIDNAINQMMLSFPDVSFLDIKTSNDAINSNSNENSKKNIEMNDRTIKQNIEDINIEDNYVKDNIKYYKNFTVIENEKSKDNSHKRKNVKDKVETTVKPFVLLYDENSKIKILTPFDEFYNENLLNYIDDIWDLIKTNKSPDMIKNGLHQLLINSNDKTIVSYLIKHHMLKKIMEQVQNKPELMEICFDIILKISDMFKQTINYIGNFNQFVMLILNQLKSTDNLVLNNLLKILQLAAHNIKIKNFESRWLFHFKKYGSFAHDINAILRRHCHEKLTITAIELIRDMTKIKLPNQCTLLEELFKIPELISALMISSAQVLIAKKKLNSPINSELYLYNWLAIIVNVKSHLCVTFRRNEEKEKYLFMRILTVMLHPYQEDFSFVGRKIKQDLCVILKCLSLLIYIYHYHFYIPLLINRIMMKISLNLCADSKKTNLEVYTKQIILYISKEINDLWLKLVQCYNTECIIELMKPFKPMDRQYFIDLASSHIETRDNFRIINALKKSMIRKYKRIKIVINQRRHKCTKIIKSLFLCHQLVNVLTILLVFFSVIGIMLKRI